MIILIVVKRIVVGPRAGLAVENRVVASVKGVCDTWRLCRSRRKQRAVQSKYANNRQSKDLKRWTVESKSEERIRWLFFGCCRASAPKGPAPAETVGEEPTTSMWCGGVEGETWSRTSGTRGAEAC